ncbi:MAG: DNA repair protein RecO [Lentisphaerae bacterium GWF2_44_16]|nr:MAG: DNA repair protein RecO [Lentisphaerae bacterium GWF2_44_16]
MDIGKSKAAFYFPDVLYSNALSGRIALNTTELLVLRKTAYKESSFIISGLSAEYGKLDFMVKGARQVSRKKFPVIDLFREISVQFNKKKSGLQALYSVELVSSHDGISSIPENFISACDLSSFILLNLHPMIECHVLYTAFKTALNRMSSEKSSVPWPALVKLAFLEENGFLPEKDFGDGKEKLLERLIAAAAGKIEAPSLSPEYWARLARWIDSLCDYHDLKRGTYRPV